MFALVARSAAQRTVGDTVPSSATPLLPLQRTLTIGPVDDQLEREADATAARVMRMPGGLPPSRVSPAGMDSALNLQRKCACGGTCSKCEQDPAEPDELSMKSTSPGAVAGTPVPPSVHWVLSS